MLLLIDYLYVTVTTNRLVHVTINRLSLLLIDYLYVTINRPVYVIILMILLVDYPCYSSYVIINRSSLYQ